jgi:hypothetical protein
MERLSRIVSYCGVRRGFAAHIRKQYDEYGRAIREVVGMRGRAVDYVNKDGSDRKD